MRRRWLFGCVFWCRRCRCRHLSSLGYLLQHDEDVDCFYCFKIYSKSSSVREFVWHVDAFCFTSFHCYSFIGLKPEKARVEVDRVNEIFSSCMRPSEIALIGKKIPVLGRMRGRWTNTNNYDMWNMSMPLALLPDMYEYFEYSRWFEKKESAWRFRLCVMTHRTELSVEHPVYCSCHFYLAIVDGQSRGT